MSLKFLLFSTTIFSNSLSDNVNRAAYESRQRALLEQTTGQDTGVEPYKQGCHKCI